MASSIRKASLERSYAAIGKYHSQVSFRKKRVTDEYWKWGQFFSPEEVLSPTGLHQYDRGNLLLQTEALDALCELRKDVDKPFIINVGDHRFRGYRSQNENEKARGSRLSRHMQGIAFDITAKGMGPSELAQRAVSSGLFGGIGIYKNFVHLDTRPQVQGIFVWRS